MENRNTERLEGLQAATREFERAIGLLLAGKADMDAETCTQLHQALHEMQRHADGLPKGRPPAELATSRPLPPGIGPVEAELLLELIKYAQRALWPEENIVEAVHDLDVTSWLVGYAHARLSKSYDEARALCALAPASNN